MIKLAGMLKRKQGTTSDQFHNYWKNVHAPFVQTIPEFTRYVRKYVQSHATADQTSVPGTNSAPPFDGLAEIWFDSIADMRKAFSEPRYMADIRPDELKFLDLPNCLNLIVEEIPMP
ncbi:MAG: EthD domain-containing protein [Candidatus Binataceae bacterium]